MQIHKLSTSCDVRCLTQADAQAILALYESNPQYFIEMHEFPTDESVKADLTALPRGRTAKDKFYVGFYCRETFVAVMDLILGYPDAQTAFIGLFMVDAAHQGRGLGSSIIADVLAYLKTLGFSSVRLGYVQSNAQSKTFWEKNGFTPTGAKSEREKYVIVIMQRQL